MSFLKVCSLAIALSNLGAAKEWQTRLVSEHGCPDSSLSCPKQLPPNIDSCCLNHPSGHFLLSQFWDANPALGTADTWTTHGLWPDLCSGGFNQFCDRSREYSNISAILKEMSSSSDLLNFMSERWLSLNGDNNHLWAHEWNKHGTCISTLEQTCYPAESGKFAPVLDYFNHATNLYSTLGTFQILAAHEIRPSHDKTYSLSDLQNAIGPSHDDYDVTFRCHGHELNEIWYHFSIRGSLRNAPAFNSSLSLSVARESTRQIFIPTSPGGIKSNCPMHGIKYLPKSPTRPSQTSASASSTSTTQPSPTSTEPFSGRGHLLVRVVNDSSSPSSSDTTTGCLIRGGKWYHTSDSSCATYIAKADVKHLSTEPDIQSHSTSNTNSSVYVDSESDHLFTLSSLYSPCAILPLTSEQQSGLFTCAKDLGIQSIFSYKDEGMLSHLNRTTFYADKIPSKFDKVDIYATDGNGDGDEDERRKVEVQIIWKAL